jgi:hypothetical protein
MKGMKKNRNRQLPKSAPGVARRVRPKSAFAEINTGGTSHNHLAIIWQQNL